MDEPEPDGQPTAACAADVARLSELAGQLRREREERLRLERACEEARTLVHALNNALTIVGSFAANLADEIEPDHPTREGVDEIRRAEQRAAGLTRKLGDLLRRPVKSGLPGHDRA